MAMEKPVLKVGGKTISAFCCLLMVPLLGLSFIQDIISPHFRLIGHFVTIGLVKTT